MKQITLDFETYEQERRESFAKGATQGVAEARRIFIELLAGAKIESLDTDESFMIELAQDLEPRIRRARNTAGGAL